MPPPTPPPSPVSHRLLQGGGVGGGTCGGTSGSAADGAAGRISMGSNLVAVRTASRVARTAAGPQLDRNRTAGLAVWTAKINEI
ncbi:hypothetical protein THAOC_09674 [Thalassiosira oceanica]|uniref:Uncharacterized protein n=1 Tax=Thalassiosira oceanica TaxID=159749 RepID=K0SUL6_THAOC|nr:hypothetical protein THAOC_09674 [Thalassiosira oceanica]|eukprot:EJK69105.1 hypothetical protein THAOC_09674 [Thalassiosira oceanica]